MLFTAYVGIVLFAGFEPLSRSSAFAVQLSGNNAERKPWAFLASHHVTRPFRYPKYYPLHEYPFLRVLDEGDVKCTIDVREVNYHFKRGRITYHECVSQEVTGRVLVSAPVSRRIVPHPGGRDVCLLTLDDGFHEQFDAQLRDANIELQRLQLADQVLQPGTVRSCTCHRGCVLWDANCRVCLQAVTFLGHALQPATSADADGRQRDTSTLRPVAEGGAVLVRSGAGQVFARTAGPQPLEMGMCGGPVLLDQRKQQQQPGLSPTSTQSRLCYGILEGIVPLPTSASGAPGVPEAVVDHRQAKAMQVLGGCAVYIDAVELRSMLT
jgi:hypothetical protein